MAPLALQCELLVRRVLASGERPSSRVLPAGLPFDLPPLEDPLRRGTQAARNAEARALLAAAGYPRADSAPLVFRVPSGNGEQMCVAVAAMWTALGIPVRIERSEISSMISDLRQGNFDIALTGAQEPPAVEPFLERFRAASTYNSGRYSSREFETALDLALQQADPQQRARGLQRAEVQHGIILAEDVVEAALRDTHVQRHLAAFEALDGHARTGLLTLLAACRGLALARADTTADTDTALAGTGIVADVIQFHCVHSLKFTPAKAGA